MTENPSAELDPSNKQRFWKSHIENWQQSKMSQVAYCREHALKLHQFTYWKTRLSRQDADISFVPLRLTQNLPVAINTASFNLFTPNGYRIEVGAGFDPTTLKQLISAVQLL